MPLNPNRERASCGKSISSFSRTMEEPNGIVPLYTPLSGSWLNTVQRIVVCRALSGYYPQTQEQITEWLEQTVADWNWAPVCVEWQAVRAAQTLGWFGSSCSALHKLIAD